MNLTHEEQVEQEFKRKLFNLTNEYLLRTEKCFDVAKAIQQRIHTLGVNLCGSTIEQI